jgi:ATP-dependent Clp protease ATP-binding subunit ClpA
MDRVIAQQLKQLLMSEILFGSLKQGGNVTISIHNSQFIIRN